MSTCAIIPAAGLPREDTFSPMMCIGGQPIIAKLVDCLHDAKINDMVVVTGFRADQIVKCLEGKKCRFVHNYKFKEARA